MNNNTSLRKGTKQDAEMILKWRNSEFVRASFILQDEITKETHLKWIAREDVAQYVILHDEIPVGSAYLRDIDHINSKAESGLFIGSNEFSGKGIGKEATRLLMEIAFLELKLNKVYLRVFSDNIAAINIYKKNGFNEVGVLKQDVKKQNKFIDVLLMEMLQSEFKELKCR